MRVLGTAVIRMEVTCDDFRLNVEELQQITDGLAVNLKAQRVIKVSDVRANDHVRAQTEGHRVLQVPTHG